MREALRELLTFARDRSRSGLCTEHEGEEDGDDLGELHFG